MNWGRQEVRTLVAASPNRDHPKACADSKNPSGRQPPPPLLCEGRSWVGAVVGEEVVEKEAEGDQRSGLVAAS